VHFYAGTLTEALGDFRQLTAVNPDSYSAIWSELAERRNGAPGHLREAMGRLDMTKWPAPVVRMLLGDETPAETLAAA
ncbi:hypothetical protein, partial [Enterobacter hormaechei]|uniref:hypothetical protein n=1 Tax=Enterobacter hormaechei TaxID=158836 RepID=UPI001954FBCB